MNPRGSTGASTPTTARQRGFASLLTPSASLLPLRLRFAPDKGSVPKAPVSPDPWPLSSFFFPLSAFLPYPTIQLTNYPTSPASLRTKVQSPRLLFPLNQRGFASRLTPSASLLPLRSGHFPTFYFLLSAFYCPTALLSGCSTNTFPFFRPLPMLNLIIFCRKACQKD